LPPPLPTRCLGKRRHRCDGGGLGLTDGGFCVLWLSKTHSRRQKCESLGRGSWLKSAKIRGGGEPIRGPHEVDAYMIVMRDAAFVDSHDRPGVKIDNISRLLGHVGLGLLSVHYHAV